MKLDRRDMVADIMEFEAGTMPEAEVGPFFQNLADTGFLYQLQGFYGRYAQALADAGVITLGPRK